MHHVKNNQREADIVLVGSAGPMFQLGPRRGPKTLQRPVRPGPFGRMPLPLSGARRARAAAVVGTKVGANSRRPHGRRSNGGREGATRIAPRTLA